MEMLKNLLFKNAKFDLEALSHIYTLKVAKELLLLKV